MKGKGAGSTDMKSDVTLAVSSSYVYSKEKTAKPRYVGSMILKFLTILAAVITFAILLFLIGYILVKGVPYLNADLFSLTYDSENVSLLPALINNVFI